MTELLQIQEPEGASRDSPKWKALFELGFRPLYLAGCGWAANAITLWIFAPEVLQGRLSGTAWHAHEMLWGFIATIAVGFLFTASSNWTGMNPLSGPALGALCLLWMLSRLGFLAPGAGAFLLSTVGELVFFLWAAAALGVVIYRKRSRRNYGLPLLVLALGVADFSFLLAVWQGDHARLVQHFSLGMLIMASIALLVARRVIPFFAMRAVSGLRIPMQTRSGHLQMLACALAAAFLLLGWRSATAAAQACAGAIALLQLASWKPWSVRRIPLLWVLYLGYAGLGAGMLVAGAYMAGWVSRIAWPVHVIGLTGFSVLIVGMVTRTALGHLGRPLRTDRSMVLCYVLILTAAVLRLVALLPFTGSWIALQCSAAAWVLAFTLYVWRFLPMMIRPRVDQAVVMAQTRLSQ